MKLFLELPYRPAVVLSTLEPLMINITRYLRRTQKKCSYRIIFHNRNTFIKATELEKSAK